MKIDLSNRVVLVTGAGRGIGRAVAHGVAQAGGSVVLTARSEGQLQEVAAEVQALGGTAHSIARDLCERDAAAQLVAECRDRFQRIDVLVNNAGRNHIANLVMSKEEDFLKVHELNVNALFRLTKAATRAMIRAKWGRVINISSVAALHGSAYNSAYASSKAAVLGFTRAVAREMAQVGITSNAICPWHVDTHLVRQSMDKRAKLFGKTGEQYLEEVTQSSPMKRLVRADEVAALAVFLMSDHAASITGQTLHVCGGAMIP